MEVPKYLRSPLAIARDDWFDSPEGRRMCQGSAEGEYLRNRLERAFIAGVKAGETLSGEFSKLVPKKPDRPKTP